MKKILTNVSFDKMYIWVLALFAFSIPYKNNFSNIALISLVFFSICCVNRRSLKKRVRDYAWILLLINGLVFFLGCFFINKEISFNGFNKIGKVVLLLLMPVLLHKYRTLKEENIIFLAFGCGVVIGLVLCWTAFFLNSTNIINYSNFTAPMGGIHPVYFSQFVVMAFFIFLENLLRSIKLEYKIILIVLLIFLSISLFYIQARTPVVAFILCLFVFAFYKILIQNDIKNLKYLILVIFLGALIFFIAINDIDYLLIKDRMINNFNEGLTIRLHSWRCAWNVFIENPKLLGVGFSNTQYYLDECYKSSYLARPYFEHYNSHNQYLQILVSSGVIGIISWLFMVGYAFYRTIINNNLLGLIFLILFSICCITEVYLVRIWGVLFYALFYSLLVFRTKKEKMSDNLKE
ncbi:O-antigen ligase family protein [Tamlana sp. 2201CG12-4]|uniref:O-antigen ligase family protein n=1 Tax=Tamlana sp. 2201CG12-4 TaxID=3112582 RepID=UPI002DBE2033|nr:O-antigen ligase family protein [Tamlana sp. 2201CG12-4]MEC3906302.1 O-antigen ligase family protein [Tamlana sp. 2201CG12-4]